jgi:hypothetical protein
MKNKTKDLLVEFKNKEDNIQKGLLLESDQTQTGRENKTAMIRLCDNNMNLLTGNDGKQIITFKRLGEYNIIGFVD